MSGTIAASVAIHGPEPGDMTLHDLGGVLTLAVHPNVYITLGDFTSDVAAEAVAMRKLEALAGQAATLLEHRARGGGSP